MAKKAKAFSKIFKAGEVKKSLLGEDDFDEKAPERSETELDTFDDDFPLEPTKQNIPEEDDIFGTPTTKEGNGAFDDDDALFEGGGFSVDDTGAFDDSGFELDAGATAGAFEGAEFPEDVGFEGVEEGGMLMDFPTNDSEEEDEMDLPEIDPAVVDAAFQASFSGLNAAIKATTTANEESQQPGKNVKKRFTKLFKLKDNDTQPVSRCGEIVVDKSKIPTTKVDLNLEGGVLVAKPDPQLEEEEEEPREQRKSSRFQSLKKTLKKKAEEIGAGIVGPGRERVEDSDKGMDGTENSVTKDHSEEVEFDTSQTDGEPTKKQRHRRRRSHEDAPLPSGETQRRSRRRESRADNSGKGGTRMRRTRTSDDGIAGEGPKMRRTRTSDTGGSGGGGRRRQSLLEKQSGVQSNGPRKSSKSVGGMSDESSSRARSRREKGEMADGSSRKGEMADGSTTRRGGRRDGTGRREGKKSIRKAVSSDGSEPRNKKGDALSMSTHAPMRRTQTLDNSMAYRRAQSTRRLGNNDLLSDKNGGLSDRERLRRATLTGENKADKHLTSKKQTALGNLYGGGASRTSDDKEEEEDDKSPARRSRVGSDGDILEETFNEEEEDEEEEFDAPLDAKDVIFEEPDEDGADGDHLDSFTDDAFVKAMASETLGAADIEKLVRAVARQAEGAKDTQEAEAIVKEAFHKSCADFESSFANLIDEELDSSVESEFSEDDGKTKGGLNRKDIQDRTRNYVNGFLKANSAAGGGTRVGKLVAAELGKRTGGIKGDYTSALKGMKADAHTDDISIEDGDDFDESAKRPSFKIREAMDDSSKRETADESRGATILSRIDMSKKMELVKAAKALEKESTKSDSKQKPDFSAVASRLEAKAEAKTKARTRIQVAAAK